MKAYLARVFRYMAWADQKALEALRAAPAAESEALALLAHLLAAEHIWLSRLEQREPRHPVWPTLGLGECDTLAAENDLGYRAYIDRLDDDQLSRLVHYRTSQGQKFATSILDILTHVVTHGPYHRGQIARAIGRAGGTAIPTDFILFARQAEPPG